MRSTSLLRTLLGLQHIRILDVGFDREGLQLGVAPTTRVPRCGGCGRKVHRGYDQRARRWRHLDFGGMPVFLNGVVRRVECPRCGVRAERMPWASEGSRFTTPFEEHTAYLAQRTDRTSLEKIMRIAWRTVGNIIKRVTARKHAELGDPLDHVRNIGVDELSYRKHHRYITVVVDHDRGTIVWAGDGKRGDTLREFFDRLGSERTQRLASITADMSATYRSVIEERAPQAVLIFDRFHVQRLAHDALDKVRRIAQRDMTHAEHRALAGSRKAMHKNTERRTSAEHAAIEAVEKTARPIWLAFFAKERLRHILDRRQANVARTALYAWIDFTRAYQIPPLTKLTNTIERHLDGIVEYIRTRRNNGRVEGLNGKLRTLTRRAYGFHSASALIAMLHLCCGKLDVNPAHLHPEFTH